MTALFEAWHLLSILPHAFYYSSLQGFLKMFSILKSMLNNGQTAFYLVISIDKRNLKSSTMKAFHFPDFICEHYHVTMNQKARLH